MSLNARLQAKHQAVTLHPSMHRRSPPSWLRRWRHMVSRTLTWARQAQRFLRGVSVAQIEKVTTTATSSTSVATGQPTTMQITSVATPTSSTCPHQYMVRHGNRHGRFAKCQQCGIKCANGGGTTSRTGWNSASNGREPPRPRPRPRRNLRAARLPPGRLKTSGTSSTQQDVMDPNDQPRRRRHRTATTIGKTSGHDRQHEPPSTGARGREEDLRWHQAPVHQRQLGGRHGGLRRKRRSFLLGAPVQPQSITTIRPSVWAEPT